MTNYRRQAIECLANSIRNQLHMNTPLNMQSIVSGLNGTLQPITFEDPSISGRIQKKMEHLKFPIMPSIQRLVRYLP